ncbi:hypothetical protein EMIT036CA2_11303 [Chryseobacterium sp. IT-36CA2]
MKRYKIVRKGVILSKDVGEAFIEQSNSIGTDFSPFNKDQTSIGFSLNFILILNFASWIHTE